MASNTTFADQPPPPPDITQTFGMFAIGTIMSSLFFGLTLLQAGIFFGKVQKGSWKVSFIVILLTVLDTVTWVLEVVVVWFYLVQNYANPAALAIVTISLQLEPVFTYFSNPNQLFWVPFHFMLAKFCVNSVIASLNIRDHMRGKDNIVSSNVFMSMGTFISRSRDNQRDQDTTNQSTGTNDMPGKSELTLTAVEGGVQIERVKFVSSV
ncbi:hypothetical protein D9757_011569 [Collybiopsis confluens]|uniref:Uncharacterized protein n=1 Tax=Collybiopsis confluens TaxID=2823264 RepID=A0A8H5GNS2_9AGAR|nr:hypothetical protein D9757_011569 [Collybiopsis confluens]